MSESEAAALVAGCDKTIELTDRQSCDTQLICNGGFSPLTGFMTEEEYGGVVESMRLPSGVIIGASALLSSRDLGCTHPHCTSTEKLMMCGRPLRAQAYLS